MSDELSDKLRKLAEVLREAYGWKATSYAEDPKSVYAVLMQAAAEIERLRDALKSRNDA